jgi:reactive intermediate/imine deaminase
MRTFLIGALAGLLAGFLAAWLLLQSMPVSQLQILSTPQQDALQLPFAEGVKVGDVLYLSGQIGAKPGTMELVPGGIKAETRQALLNIKQTLERHGSSMDKVIKCTVFMADMADWPLMNEVYVEMFAGHRPARSALGASGLALEGNVEIECMAQQ